MRIGISGHQRLKNPADWDWTQEEMSNLIKQSPLPLIGISSLAIGADQLFAKLILQVGGSLEIIVPFDDYEKRFEKSADRQEYRRLLSMASKVEVLEKKGSDEEAYLKAGERVVDLAEILIAVWDGQPAAGLGGTADIVKYAIQKQKNFVHLNPIARAMTSS